MHTDTAHPTPAETQLPSPARSARLLRNAIVVPSPFSADMVMKTRWDSWDQSIYIETTDMDVEKRLPSLGAIEGVFAGVGNPWKLLTQALALKRCDGVIALDHHPMQTEVLFPLFLDALRSVPFSQDREKYIRTICVHIGRDLPYLIADIEQKYPALFAMAKTKNSYAANYRPEEIVSYTETSLSYDFGKSGSQFVLATQDNIEKVIGWMNAGKLASATADLTDPRLADVLYGSLTKLNAGTIAAMDISNIAWHDEKNTLIQNMSRQPALAQSAILHSDGRLRALLARNIDEIKALQDAV